ncbi:MAG: bifunctional riboflavin kinase/FAD synthetase [Alphaproteobacteria bacterium]|jgi:riboflavin kinase/FMN adenylyltransferase|nr:bifunctional riboflavin kinase/FAD synthetase [Alphaproteobacteria bacterium]
MDARGTRVETPIRVVREYRGLPATLKGSVAALGNFDGVHLGHQALLADCGRIASAAGRDLAVVTFEPHPRRVFTPGGPAFRLTPFRSKARILAGKGVKLLFALRFNEALYSKTAEVFVDEVLVHGLAVAHVVVGYDFVFGHQRSGDAEFLREAGVRHGFGVSVIEPVMHDNDVCSSSIIRVDLEGGRARRAAELLGHWWEVEGRVHKGDQRGRQLGFPTLNLHLSPHAFKPALGVYAVHVGIAEGGATRWCQGVANIGRRPTFDGQSVVLEVHVFDYTGDLYGHQVRVAFVEHLRPERKFNGLEALKAQIQADGEAARGLLAQPENRLDAYPTPCRTAD